MAHGSDSTNPIVYSKVGRLLAKVGSDVASARRERGMTPAEFAGRMGVSETVLYRLEVGDPTLTLNTLGLAMHVLGTLDLSVEGPVPRLSGAR